MTWTFDQLESSQTGHHSYALGHGQGSFESDNATSVTPRNFYSQSAADGQAIYARTVEQTYLVLQPEGMDGV